MRIRFLEAAPFFALVAAVCPFMLLAHGPARGSQAGTADLTIEQVLSAPFPSEMVAAPTGGNIAWVFNDRGVRNIWVASPPDYRGRKLSGYSDDDGQEITDLTFDGGGKRIVYVRGGAPNSGGELPNPTSDPEGVERGLWWIDLGDPEPHRIGAGSSPLFLADGALVFLDQGKVRRTKLAPSNKIGKRGRSAKSPAGEPPSAEEIIHARGSISNLRLSPDGQRLALVSRRGSHSFVGVFDLAQKSLSFLSPSLDRDSSPVWSPDGRRVAFLRQPARSAQSIFEPERSGQPWSIRIAEVETGESRQVFLADAGRGSVFREVVSPDQLFWTRSGRIVFPWEKDGWTHLYAVVAMTETASPQRSQPRLLTPGDFEVEYVALSTDGEGVVFSSNQGDIDRRHLWRVAPDALAPTALTTGNGVENVPVPIPGSDAIALVGASGTRPLEPRVLRASGAARALVPEALASFPLDLMVEPEPVIFAAADGMKIHGQLFEPPSSFTGKRPALVFFHGGSRRHMMLGWHYSSYYHNCYAFHQYMASRGYLVLSVNYRSGIGYGLEFREALDYGATGASELNDVLGAGLYLRSRDDVDPDRIGLWGGSYGGYLTALGLARASDLFAAGVDIHGVHDWNRTIKNFIPSYNPLEDPERTRLAFESSPMSSVETWRSPVLLIHGDDDRNVPFEESVTLVEKLREHGVEHEVLVFPDEVHGFLRYESWLQVFVHAADFIERRLGVRASSERKVAAR